jgi:hypothetical protein
MIFLTMVMVVKLEFSFCHAVSVAPDNLGAKLHHTAAGICTK